jgi:ABC-2 type transport system permease protein
MMTLNVSSRWFSNRAAMWSAYAYCVKTRMLGSLAYTIDVWVSLAAQFVLMIGTLFLWRCAYTGVDSVAGVGRSQMLTYAIVSVLLGSIFRCGVQEVIPNRVSEGDIAVDLMRPLNPLGRWMADDVGEAVAAVGMQLVPLLVLGTVLMHVPLPAGPGALLTSVPMCILGYLINWLVAALVGMLAFWTIQLGHFDFAKDAIVRILSGALVPLWFFPDWFERLVRLTPFPYMYQAPLAVYIGRTAPREALGVVVIQLVWAVLLLGAVAAVWSAARRRVFVQGG